MKIKQVRKREAQTREAAYGLLTTKQKVVILDLKLGGDQGAKRQRERLAARLVYESQVEVVKMSKSEVIGQDIGRKPYQKPKRS